MNLQDQIGALEAGVDQLIDAVTAVQAAYAADPTSTAEPAAARAEPAAHAASPVEEPEKTVAAANGAEPAADATGPGEAAEAKTAAAAASAPDAAQPTLQIGRPSQNEITMTIGDRTVSLHPFQVGQLVEELANARASMTPEAPPEIPPGWRFVSTKNPVFAVQKQSNGDRLLVLRHTGHGWVPFTFSPDMVIQMYMMLTQR